MGNHPFPPNSTFPTFSTITTNVPPLTPAGFPVRGGPPTPGSTPPPIHCGVLLGDRRGGGAVLDHDLEAGIRQWLAALPAHGILHGGSWETDVGG